MGPAIDELTVGDPPEAWAGAGFTVDDDGTCRVGTVRLRLVGRALGKHIQGWSLRNLAGVVDDLDGVPTAASDRPPAEPAVHPNGVTAIDHVVVLTPDRARTVAALGALGLEPRRSRKADPDTYGMPVVQTFFRLDEVILELIGPEEPTGDGPARFFGLAHTVSDLDATATFYGDRLGRVKDAVQPGRQIATLRHKDLGLSVATAFMSPEPARAG